MLKPRRELEILMRLSPLVLAFGLAASSLAVPVVGQKPDDQISPKSIELQKKGEAALAAGRLMDADDAFETALAVDPRNRAAFVDMANVAMKQRLYGQAIRLTNKALQLEPTDRDALAVQGTAMVELGAAARAKEVLAKLQKVCTSGCPQLAELNAAISRGPSLAQAKPPAGTPKKN